MVSLINCSSGSVPVRNRKPATAPKAEVPGESKRIQRGNKFKTRNAVPLANIFKNQRYWARFVVIFAVVVIIYVSSLKEKDRKFARQREVLPLRFQPLRCQSPEAPIKGCTPKNCGRFVSDKLITDEELKFLLAFAKAGFASSGLEAGSSATFDLHSGTVSNGDAVKDVSDKEGVFSNEQHLLTFKLVKLKVLQALVERFDINRKQIHLASPTVFSKLTNTSLLDHSQHQVDRRVFPNVFFTTMVYLNDQDKDFKGGRFIYIDDTATNKSISSVEAKSGRIMAYTTGPENVHYLEPVTIGTQYFLTIPFTCLESAAVSDPPKGYSSNKE